MSAGFRQGPSRSMMLVIVTSPICNCFICPPPSSEIEPIEACGRAAEQIGLFGRACSLCEDLAGVPERCVAIGTLVHREVALKHATGRTERFNAGFDVGLPGGCQGFR